MLLIGWLDWLVRCLVGWSQGGMIGLVGGLVAWLPGWPLCWVGSGWLVGWCLVGWLGELGCLIVWSGWLDRWLSGGLAACSSVWLRLIGQLLAPANYFRPDC